MQMTFFFFSFQKLAPSSFAFAQALCSMLARHFLDFSVSQILILVWRVSRWAIKEAGRKHVLTMASRSVLHAAVC